MICAWCGERPAFTVEEGRPICHHCAELPLPTWGELLAEINRPALDFQN